MYSGIKKSIACGVDCEKAGRIHKMWQNDSLPRELFTLDELASFNKKSNLVEITFLAKESLLKSFGAGWFNTSIKGSEINILMHDDVILCELTGAARELFDENEFDFIKINTESSMGYNFAFSYMGSNVNDLAKRLKKIYTFNRLKDTINNNVLINASNQWVKSYSYDGYVLGFSGLIKDSYGKTHLIDSKTNTVADYIDMSISHSGSVYVLMLAM
ncbi:MAG: 4'-phosphopantetheinyl transferase superfamily protein [Gammaproteobacteria bacterium]|nr:4'-phosphopantetheinyl transferase superfamily protein [Gammaproteobacteria bacterium]